VTLGEQRAAFGLAAGRSARGESLRYYRLEMADAARRRATYDDLLQVPDHLVAEIIDGELVTSPRPAPAHARAASSLGGELYGPFDRGKNGPGGWVILDEPELHLHGQVLVPDLAGWRRERMPELPDAVAFELEPDWVCEVLSPSTAARDRADKVPIYLREGVSNFWLVDPSSQTQEAFKLDGTGYRLLGSWRGSAVVQVEPFGALALDLSALWSR
jgi:Uma2 family endonuclease